MGQLVWTGETTCNLCEAEEPSVLIDGRTKMGMWCTMCATCHFLFGAGVGTGNGQMYHKGTNEEGEVVYVCIAGDGRSVPRGNHNT